jgi:Na+/proline symporter
MVLTSTIFSSMIAVSSILSFDIYKTYIDPKASDMRLVHVSYLAVVAHAIFVTGVSLGMNYGGANVIWRDYFWPILTFPGIIPLIFFTTRPGQMILPPGPPPPQFEPTNRNPASFDFSDLQKV